MVKLLNNNNNESYEIKMATNTRIVIGIISIVLTLGSIVLYAGQLKEKITNNSTRIESFENTTKQELEQKVEYEIFKLTNESLEKRIDSFISDNERAHLSINEKIEKIESKIDGIDAKVDKIDKHLYNIEENFKNIAKYLDKGK